MCYNSHGRQQQFPLYRLMQTRSRDCSLHCWAVPYNTISLLGMLTTSSDGSIHSWVSIGQRATLSIFWDVTFHGCFIEASLRLRALFHIKNTQFGDLQILPQWSSLFHLNSDTQLVESWPNLKHSMNSRPSWRSMTHVVGCTGMGWWGQCESVYISAHSPILCLHESGLASFHLSLDQCQRVKPLKHMWLDELLLFGWYWHWNTNIEWTSSALLSPPNPICIGILLWSLL